MIAALAHQHLADEVATLGLALVLAGGLIHGLYASSRKVKTTV